MRTFLFNKKAIILLVTGLLLIVSILFFLNFSSSFPTKQKEKRQKTLPSPLPQKPNTVLFTQKKEALLRSHKNEIVSVPSCIQNLKDKRLTYSAERVCDIQTRLCNQLENINTQGPAQIWANYYMQKMQDTFGVNKEFYLDLLNKDLLTYNTLIPNQQNMHLNCPFFWDLYRDKNLDKNTKDIAKKQCVNTIMRPDFESFIDSQIQSNALTDTRAFDLITNPTEMLQFEKMRFERLVLFPIEYSYRYLFTNNNQDKLRALYSLILAISFINTDPQGLYLSDKCYLGKGLLSAFEITKNKQYIVLAKNLYIKENISNIAIKQVENRFEDKAVCFYFIRHLINRIHELNDISLYKEIINVYETAFNRLLLEYHDSEGKIDYFNGDGCFNTYRLNNTVIKSTLLNALVLGSMIQ